jgi:hypothetical protein
MFTIKRSSNNHYDVIRDGGQFGTIRIDGDTPVFQGSITAAQMTAIIPLLDQLEAWIKFGREINALAVDEVTA